MDNIKILLGITDDTRDELIELLMEQCKIEVVSYCNLKEYDEKLNPILNQMVIEKFNRLGSEGLSSAASSGISETYIDGYSAFVVSLLNKNKKVRML